MLIALKDPLKGTIVRFFPLGAEAQRFEIYLHNYPNPWHQEERLLGQFCNLLRCTLPENDRRRAGCVFSDLLMSTMGRLSILALAYLTAGVSLTVRVQPEKLRAVKPRMAKERPWLAPLRAREDSAREKRGKLDPYHWAYCARF